MIMIKKKGFLLISIIISLSVLLIGSSLTYFAYQEKQSIASFPSYRYEEYIDKSDTMGYNQEDGGQLYESEQSDFTTGISKVDVVGASKDRCLWIEEKESSVSYTINSSSEDVCMLALNMAYVTSFNRDIPYNSLLEIRVNNTLRRSSSLIKHSYNKYEFFETSLFSFNILKGINTINIFFYENDVYLDYLSLISANERSGEKETIGEKYYTFKGDDSSQSYQIERGKLDNALIVDDGDALNYRSVLMVNMNATITYLINSDQNKETLLTINGKVIAETDALLRIECDSFVQEMTINQKDDYQDYNVGKISLKEGNNQIKFTLLNGKIHLNEFTLNSDINHSLYKYCERFEVENALIEGNASIEDVDTASEKKSVGNISENTSFSFNGTASHSDEAYLSLSISYWGDDTYLSSVLSIFINEEEIDLSNIVISGNDRKYFEFRDLYISPIHLGEGLNTIVIISKLNELFNLDYLSIFHKLSDLSLLECEHMSLLNGCREEINYSASNLTDVGYNCEGSGVALSLLFDQDGAYYLSICLALNSSQLEKASQIFEIFFNDEKVDITQIYLLPTEGWTNFRLNENVALLNVRKGLNVLRIMSLGEFYNLDYLSISK